MIDFALECFSFHYVSASNRLSRQRVRQRVQNLPNALESRSIAMSNSILKEDVNEDSINEQSIANCGIEMAEVMTSEINGSH